jgi:hypothetical protein
MPAGPGQLLALMVVTTTIGGILAAGGLAEFLAVDALYQEKASVLTGRQVLLLTTFLIIVVVARPFLTYMRAVYRPLSNQNTMPPSLRMPPAR